MIKDIFFNKILIGQVYDLNLAKGVNFPTLDEQEFQFGFGVADEDKILTPHIHKRVERVIQTTSEFLYVVNGLMTILKKDTKYFEIKQGPYYGRDFDKYELKE